MDGEVYFNAKKITIFLHAFYFFLSSIEEDMGAEVLADGQVRRRWCKKLGRDIVDCFFGVTWRTSRDNENR